MLTVEHAEPAEQEDRLPPAGTGAVPPISDLAVVRPRLVGELRSRLERFGLVHVVAPAGAGKTTALVQACRELGRPVAWLTLERWDQRPGRLVEDLVAAVSALCPVVDSTLPSSVSSPEEKARLLAECLGARRCLLVIEDVHVLDDALAASDTLAAFLRGRHPRCAVVLSGRSRLQLPGLGVEALDPESVVRAELLRADVDEAEAILRGRGSTADPRAAIEATGGWVAGLVFESWRGRGSGEAADDAFSSYVSDEIRRQLSPQLDDFLVACSVFDRVDRARAIFLAGEDGPALLDALAGLDLLAVWDEHEDALRLHPRVREILRSELERRPADVAGLVLAKAGAALEHEGALEPALDTYLRAGALDDAARLLPAVIMPIVERLDVELANEYLDAIPLDPEPSTVTLARLALASIGQNIRGALSLLGSLAAADYERLAREEPTAGALACNMLLGAGRAEEALEVYRVIPPGRAADVARLLLSLHFDDPDGPIPDLRGDLLDAVIFRCLYCRGKLDRIRDPASETIGAMSGVPELSELAAVHDKSRAPLGAQLARIGRAVEARDVDAALDAIGLADEWVAGVWTMLARAEIAVRLQRDSASALEVIDRIRSHRAAPMALYRELTAVWEGAALLLRGDADERAGEILRAAVDTMRRGDRALELPSALVYLAEAEWRLGHEDDADRATEEAYAVAQAHDNLRRLMLALRDFPGVLSRRLDLESGGDSGWRVLGRAIARQGRAGAHPAVTPVRLRELGDPVLIVDSREIRPRIRKSIELLSFLLSRPRATASRDEILNALWDGRDEPPTRAYLRQALRHLRDALPAGIEIDQTLDTFSVEGPIASDVSELEALLRQAAHQQGERRLHTLRAALELGGRGAVLEGSRGVGWVAERRTAIDALLTTARLDAAESFLDHSRYPEALALVDDVLRRDPLLERGWRLRMQVLGMLGDRDGVLGAFRRCLSELAAIDLEPSPATYSLAEQLRR